MNKEENKMTEQEISELADKILEIERAVRSDKSGNRTVIVGKILALLKETTKNDN